VHGKAEKRLTLLGIREAGTVGVMSTYGRYWFTEKSMGDRHRWGRWRGLCWYNGHLWEVLRTWKSRREVDTVGDKEGDTFGVMSTYRWGGIGCMEKPRGD